MQVNSKKYPANNVQSGFSLIQLMVAIPLGLLVMLSVMKIYSNSMQSVHLQNTYSRVQENGRMATELMTRDIRGADFWGCMGDSAAITNNLDPNATGYATAINPADGGVSGSNNVSSSTIDSISVVDGSDTLILRSAASLSDIKVVAPYMTANSSAIQITAGSILERGDIVLISDCGKADLFTNTSANTDVSGVVGHSDVALTGAVKNLSQSLAGLYGSNAQILIPFVQIYFVGINSEGGGSLYRTDNGTATELVRGVVGLQLKYGEDTSGDGSANTFVDVPSDMSNVLSIKVTLSAQSGENLGGTELVRDYEVTANIRNRTLR